MSTTKQGKDLGGLQACAEHDELTQARERLTGWGVICRQRFLVNLRKRISGLPETEQARLLAEKGF